ncbi:hypothetical protein like AT4G32030 [Hibiscus trionum]|uniref:Uncharacterized protein n=1 Tax=Hibiscus trionum TaxID=183268 RepID=A0A9W7MSN1_HIBTR|nr:hypothetical protein like AT4G32030 [Hibiscus trionum]
MAVKDEWVRAAMKDDNVVAELLLRLKQAEAAIPATKRAVTTLKWGLRQLRSRATLTRCGGKRDGDFSTRCSPNTPLSWWSGGASPSAADGFEATSRPPPSRSKGTAAAVNEGIKSTTKRIRRKKTCAQLKEEENLLLKERIHLQEEIASMHATCEEQRVRNEHLKRIKLHLDLRIAKNAGETEKVLPCRSVRSIMSSPPLDSDDVDCLVLPDLNMVPGEDERSR